jgi:hypothetical protein
VFTQRRQCCCCWDPKPRCSLLAGMNPRYNTRFMNVHITDVDGTVADLSALQC